VKRRFKQRCTERKNTRQASYPSRGEHEKRDQHGDNEDDGSVRTELPHRIPFSAIRARHRESASQVTHIRSSVGIKKYFQTHCYRHEQEMAKRFSKKHGFEAMQAEQA